MHLRLTGGVLEAIAAQWPPLPAFDDLRRMAEEAGLEVSSAETYDEWARVVLYSPFGPRSDCFSVMLAWEVSVEGQHLMFAPQVTSREDDIATPEYIEFPEYSELKARLLAAMMPKTVELPEPVEVAPIPFFDGSHYVLEYVRCFASEAEQVRTQHRSMVRRIRAFGGRVPGPLC